MLSQKSSVGEMSIDSSELNGRELNEHLTMTQRYKKFVAMASRNIVVRRRYH